MGLFQQLAAPSPFFFCIKRGSVYWQAYGKTAHTVYMGWFCRETLSETCTAIAFIVFFM